MESNLKVWLLLGCIPSLLLLGGCGGKVTDVKAEAPPASKVSPDVDVTLFSVEHPEQFPFSAATEHRASSELVVTGTVTCSRTHNRSVSAALVNQALRK